MVSGQCSAWRHSDQISSIMYQSVLEQKAFLRSGFFLLNFLWVHHAAVDVCILIHDDAEEGTLSLSASYKKEMRPFFYADRRDRVPASSSGHQSSRTIRLDA